MARVISSGSDGAPAAPGESATAANPKQFSSPGGDDDEGAGASADDDDDGAGASVGAIAGAIAGAKWGAAIAGAIAGAGGAELEERRGPEHGVM